MKNEIMLIKNEKIVKESKTKLIFDELKEIYTKDLRLLLMKMQEIF